MRRREFISFLGVTAGWPSVLNAQSRERPLRVGVLQGQPETDENFRAFRMMFVDRLRQLGWTDGENLRIDYRYGAGDAASMPAAAKELVDLNPDVILAITALAAMAIRQYTLSIPIVFVQVGDPVALGLVTNLARPAGNLDLPACSAARNGSQGEERAYPAAHLESLQDAAAHNAPEARN